MTFKRFFPAIIIVILAAALIFGIAGCTAPSTSPPNTTSSSPTTPAATVTETTSPTPGGPGGGAVINSDSIVTATIQAIRQQTSGYPWELDILVQSSIDVGSLPNPTKDSIGKVITVKTDQDLNTFKVNDNITARVKYVGDVPKPGITLYIYDLTNI
jgi:hypothetical protein